MGFYNFLKPKSMSFFDEGGESESEADLLAFEFDRDASLGMTSRIVDEAREQFAGLPSAAANAVLWLGDGLLDVVLEDVVFVVGGRKKRWNEIDLRQVNHLDLIQPILLTVAKSRIEIGDEENCAPEFQMTPARFCAAFALKMAYNGTRPYLREGSELRDHYLMLSACAYGLMLSFSPANHSEISGVVSTQIRTTEARMRAEQKWRNDPKSMAMREIKRKWDAMIDGKAAHMSDAEFAREMTRQNGLLSEGGIKNAIVRWRKVRS